MGWFNNEEVVTTNTAACPQENHQAQTIALCIIAAVAVGYVLLKSVAKIHRGQTERVAERVARTANVQV